MKSSVRDRRCYYIVSLFFFILVTVYVNRKPDSIWLSHRGSLEESATSGSISGENPLEARLIESHIVGCREIVTKDGIKHLVPRRDTTPRL